MKNEKLINTFKNGVITTVAIYFLFNISVYLIGYVLLGENIIKLILSGTSNNVPLDSFNMKAFGIISIVILVVANSGLYGTSKDVFEGNTIRFSTFLHNSKIYLSKTVVNTIICRAVFCFIAILVFVIESGLHFHTISLFNIGIGKMVDAVIFQWIFVPFIILKTLDLEDNLQYIEYIKKNFVVLLIFSVITNILAIIPKAGDFVSVILNGFYPMFILFWYEKAKNARN